MRVSATDELENDEQYVDGILGGKQTKTGSIFLRTTP